MMTSQLVSFIILLLWERSYGQPDLQVTGFSLQLSGAKLYQDVNTAVSCRVSFVNTAPSGNDVLASAGDFDNYEVTLQLTDVDLSSAGEVDSLGIADAWMSFKKSGMSDLLLKGLASESSETLTIEGHSNVKVSAANCANLKYVCVHVTKGIYAAYNEIDNENNYHCQYISDLLECTSNHVDLSILQFHIMDQVLYSGESSHLILALRVDIIGSFVLDPDPDLFTQTYKVKLFLSIDDVIEPSFDLEVTKLPRSFSNLNQRFSSSGSVYLGGSDLGIPDVHSHLMTHLYCGRVYLGVSIDHGTGFGEIPERNEWNNQLIIPVTVICPTDKWSISDMTIYLGPFKPIVYPNTSFDFTVNAIVFNMHNQTYKGGQAAFRLILYLSDSPQLGQGESLELTRVGEVDYTASRDSPMSAIPPGASVELHDVSIHVPDDIFTSNVGFTHIILKVAPAADEVDEIFHNNYVAVKVTVADTAPVNDLSVSGFTVSENRLIADGVTVPTVTLGGTVTVGSVDPASFTTSLLWSDNNIYDEKDIDSGVTITIDVDGSMTMSSTPIPIPSNSSLCGHVYAILFIDSNDVIEELYEYNNIAMDQVILACHNNDAMALNDFQLLSPEPVWMAGSDVTFTFIARVSCTAADCSGKTAGNNNFGFIVLMDTNRTRDGDEVQLNVIGAFEAIDGGQGTQEDISVASATVSFRVKVELEAVLCNDHLRYVRLELDPTDDFVVNDWLTQEVVMDCSLSGTIDIAAGAFTGITGLIVDTPSSYSASIDVTTGYMSLPHQEWPHTSVHFYITDDNQIDPNTDLEIAVYLTQCQRNELARSVPASSTETMDISVEEPGGLVLPPSGFERYCGEDVFIGIIVDRDNRIPEVDESNNVAVLASAIPASSVIGLNCPPAPSPTLKSGFGSGTQERVPSNIYVQSTYVMHLQIEVMNAHTSALIGGSAEDPDFALEVYMSADDTVDPSDIQLAVEVDESDAQKTFSGLDGGALVTIAIYATLPSSALSKDACIGLLAEGQPRLLAVTADVRTGSGFSPGTPASIDINLVCQLTLKPQLLTFSFDTVFWSGFIYKIQFSAKVTHEGKYADAFQNGSDNFDVHIFLDDGMGTSVDALNISLYDLSIKRQPIPSGEHVFISGSGELTLSLAECSVLSSSSSRSVVISISPSAHLQSLGYSTSSYSQVANAEPKKLKLVCNDSFVELEAVNFKLLDTSLEEIDFIRLDETVQYEFNAKVHAGTTDHITPFSDGIQNYRYKFLLSRDGINYEQMLSYTHPIHSSEMWSEISDETVAYSFNSNDLLITSAEGGLSCGSVYLVVVLFDLNNFKTPEATTNIIEKLRSYHTKDPIPDNNYVMKRILIKCPTDLFELSDLTISTTNIIQIEEAELEFSVTLINSHPEGYDIPKSHNGASFFDFRIVLDDNTELPLTNFLFSDGDLPKITDGLRAGEKTTFSGVKVILPVGPTACGKINSQEWFLEVDIGAGITMGMVDSYKMNDKIRIINVACSEPRDLNVNEFSFNSYVMSGTDMEIEYNLKVEYSVESDIDAMEEPGLQFYASRDSMFNESFDLPSFHTVDTSSKAAVGDGIVWTATITVTLTETTWKHLCGVIYLLVVVDPGNIVIETNENNNLAEEMTLIKCVKDVFHVNFQSEMGTLIGEGVPLSVSFSAQVYNVEPITILASTEDDNFAFKLYVQKGDVLHLGAIDITPVWKFYQNEQLRTRESLAAFPAMADFSKVQGDVLIPKSACQQGYDHLFLTLEIGSAKTSTSSSPIDECVIFNNYQSFPVTCNPLVGTDLLLKTIASSQPMFTLSGLTEIQIGTPFPFYLDVQVNIGGNHGWVARTDSQEPVFRIDFELINENGLKRKIPYSISVDKFKATVHRSTVLHLGDFLFLPSDAFLSFCGSAQGILKVVIDSENDVLETNEDNNEATLTFPVGGDVCDSQTDLELLEILLEPDHYHNVLYGSEDTTFIFKYQVAGVQPTDFKYKAILSIDKIWDNPSNADLFSGENSHSVSSGTSVSFTGQVSIYTSEDPLYKYHQQFCGQSTYVGIWINSDGAVVETDSTENNILWKPLKFLCDNIQGLAMTEFSLLRSDQGSLIRLGPATHQVYFNTTILNVGSDIAAPVPDTDDIFTFQLYINSAPQLDGATFLGATFNNLAARNVEMASQTAAHFTDISATFPLPPTSCTTGMNHLCLEVMKDSGMVPGWIDDFSGDNFHCYPLFYSDVGMDCERDISLTDLQIKPTSHSKLMKDLTVEVDFSCSLTLRGYPLQTSTQAHLVYTLYLSDQSDVTPTGAFNGGYPFLLTSSSGITLNSSTVIASTSIIENATSIPIGGNMVVSIPSAVCAVGTHICLSYEENVDMRPPIRDTDISNDFTCMAVADLLDCTNDTVDLEPSVTEYGDGVYVVGEYESFELNVKVEIGSETVAKSLSFSAKLFLSNDSVLDPLDYKIPYVGFMFGRAKLELDRHLNIGHNTINLGGDFLMIPNTIESQYCGLAYLITYIDADNHHMHTLCSQCPSPDNYVAETDETNNIAAFKVHIVCAEDVFALKDLKVDLNEVVYADEINHFKFDITVMNFGPEDLPPQTFASPNYVLQVRAAYLLPGGDIQSDVISADMIYPFNYYGPIRRLQEVTLSGVTSTTDRNLFTSEICRTAQYFMINLVPASSDTVLNHFVMVPWSPGNRDCRPRSGLPMLRLDQFHIPSEIKAPGTLDMVLILTVHPHLHPGDFVVRIYISHNPHFSITDSFLFKDIFLLQEISTAKQIDLSRQVGLDISDDQQFCGKVYFIVVIDANHDLLGPRRLDQVALRDSYLACSEDLFGISDIRFWTADNQVIADKEMSFTVAVNISCLRELCQVQPALENYVLSLTFLPTSDAVSEHVVAVIDKDWDSRPESSISPGVGEGFSYNGQWKEIQFQGLITVPAILCHQVTDNTFKLTLTLGSSLSSETDSVNSNNVITWQYQCVSDAGIDLQVTDFRMLGGDIISPEVNKFAFTLDIQGTSIQPMNTGPFISPFHVSMLWSRDSVFSADDIDLDYVMNSYTSAVLRRGIQPGSPIVIEDLQGVYIRSYLCGTSYIIIMVRFVDAIVESSKENNLKATQVYIDCPGDVLAITAVNINSENTVWQNNTTTLTTDISILNTGNQDIPPSSGSSGVSLIAVVSEDNVWQQSQDIVVDVHLSSETDIILRNGLPMSQSQMLRDVKMDVYIPSDRCSESHFIVVGALVTQPSVKDNLTDNNFWALPLHVICTESTDMLVGDFFFAGPLNLGASTDFTLDVTVVTSEVIDSSEFLLWLSVDEEIDELDIIIPHDVSMVILGIGGTITETLDIPNNLKQRFCGHTYVIVQLDSTNIIKETNEVNNVHATPVYVVCQDDAFEISSLEIILPSAGIQSGETALIKFAAEVTCIADSCPIVASHGSISLPVHFYFKIKTFTKDQQEIGTVNPSEIDAFWTSEVLGDYDDNTFIAPADALQTDFSVASDNKVQINISGHFAVDGSNDCAKIAYMGLEMVKGDSQQAESLNWTITDNNVRIVAFKLKCPDFHVDLLIRSFLLDAKDSGIIFNASKTPTLPMNMNISWAGSVWPTYPKNLPKFGLAFFISDAAPPDKGCDITYNLPASQAVKLVEMPINGLDIELSDPNMVFDRNQLIKHCNKNVSVSVYVNWFQKLVEVDESNNVAAVTGVVTGCSDINGVDIRLVDETLPDTVLSGDTLNVSFIIEAVVIGTVVLSTPLFPDNIQIHVKFGTSEEDFHMELAWLNINPVEGLTGTGVGEAVFQEYIVGYVVSIPKGVKYCDKIWLVEIMADYITGFDIYEQNNALERLIHISCPDDLLALQDVTIMSEPETFWPMMPITLSFIASVVNVGGKRFPSIPAGLFEMKVAFSVDDHLDASDSAAVVKMDGTPFVFTDEVPARQTVQTPLLTGVIDISSMDVCNQAMSHTPTLFIILVPVEPLNSQYIDNDIASFSLKDRIRCQEEQVNLFVSSFRLEDEGTATTDLKADQWVDFQLKIGMTKTSSGSIPAASPSDLGDYSMMFKLYLSLDNSRTPDDSMIPIVLSAEQKFILRRGISISQSSPYEITINGANLRIDVADNPDLAFYCGYVYLIVELEDLKNITSVDPDTRDNIRAFQYLMICDGDFLAVSDLMVAPKDPVTIIYSDVEVEIEVHFSFWNFGENIPASADGRRNFFICVYLSDDNKLDLDLDTRITIFDISDSISKALLGPAEVGQKIDVVGWMKIRLPLSACTLKYMLMEIHKGVHIITKEKIYENNIRYQDVSNIIKCSIDFVDFSAKKLILSPTSITLAIGSQHHFSFVVSITMAGKAQLSAFTVQFYLSKNAMFDSMDLSLEFSGNDQLSALDLTDITNTVIERTLYSLVEKLTIPAYVAPDFCGLVFLLAVIDDMNSVEELSEYNNGYAIPVTVQCKYDVFQLNDVDVSTTTYEYNPGPILLSFDVENVFGDDLISDGIHNMFEIKLFVRRKGMHLEHDVTPAEWSFALGEDDTLRNTILANEKIRIHGLSGVVHLVSACDAYLQPLPLGPDKADLILKIRKANHPSLANVTELIIDNNIFITEISIHCLGNNNDLEANELTVLSGNTLEFGTVDFSVNGHLLEDSGAHSYLYEVSLAAGPLKVPVGSLLSVDVSSPCNSPCAITASGNISITPEDFLFLCNFDGRISMIAEFDPLNDVVESNEQNNNAVASDLNFDSLHCTSMTDLTVLKFEITNLDLDIIVPATATNFVLEVAATVTGGYFFPSQSGTDVHFDFCFFISEDEFYNPGIDALFPAGNYDNQQLLLLQQPLPAAVTVVIQLNGSNLIIPLTKDTAKYCWTHPYIGVLIDCRNSVTEVNEGNNMALYRTIFDCGDKVDECALNLSTCDPFATCNDQVYNLRSFDGVPYTCSCPDGFEESGDGLTCVDIDECAVDTTLCTDEPYSVCNNLVGDYECACISGYTVVEQSGQQSCQNMNECTDSNLNLCHENADCTDTIGSFICTCTVGFSGDGVENCTDIVDCTDDACGGHGVCNEGTGGYTCECESGHHGPNCQTVDGDWGEWSPWSECLSGCGPGYQMRNRSCNNPVPFDGGRACSRNNEIADVEHREGCSPRLCYPGHIPWCDYDPCFRNSGGICLYQERGIKYDCHCEPGYTPVLDDQEEHFLRCRDVNECEERDFYGSVQHDCHQDADCINTKPLFYCQCKNGFTGSGIECDDINECAQEDICPPKMKCFNTRGSYMCTCQEGYIAEDGGTRCKEERLFRYGSETGDTEMLTDSKLTGEGASSLIIFPEGLPVFGEQLANSFYISENGLIGLTNRTREYDRKETFPYPNQMDYALDTSTEIVGILAPFWANNQNDKTFHKVWYNQYFGSTDDFVLRASKLLIDSINVAIIPKYTLKVTWSNMAPEYPSRTKERNTYQATVVTDSMHTYVIYLYQDEGMKWEPTHYDTTDLQLIWRGYPGKIGYAIKAPKNIDYTKENSNSGKWSVFADKPNAYRVSEKTMQSHGREGMLVYRIDDNHSGYKNPRRLCTDWFQSEGPIENWAATLLGKCPAHQNQTKFDASFKTSGDMCYIRSASNQHGASMKCCYTNEGSLLLSHRLANRYADLGGIVKYLPTFDAEILHREHDIDPYQWCCKDAELNYCEKFIEKRPVVDSSSYSLKKLAFVSGNGLVSTFDGSRYTIRGFGEYILLRSSPNAAIPFLIHLRTALSQIQETSNSKAIVPSAVAIQVGDSPSLQVYQMQPSKTVIFVDAAEYTSVSPVPLGHGVGIDHADNITHLVFDQGVAVSVGLQGSGTYIKVQVDSTLIGDVFQGLLGDYDDNVLNDIVKESGVELDQSISSDADYHDFVESWSLRNVYGSSNADEHSLFFSYSNPDSANNYFKAGFTPNFYDIAEFTSDEKAICASLPDTAPDNVCLYINKETGTNTLGSQSISFARDMAFEQAQLANFPPVFKSQTMKNKMDVNIGSIYSINIEAEDKNGPISFTVIKMQGGTSTVAMISGTPTSEPHLYRGSYNLLIESAESVQVDILATDSLGASAVFTPEIVLCACENEGQCDFNEVQWNGSFGFALCHCPPGWTGFLCDEDFHGCQIKHCYQECFDLDATSVASSWTKHEYTCSSCPGGMEGDGKTCADINECVLPSSDPRKHKCDHRCVNIKGSYRCECDSGFLLDADGIRCIDILECENTMLNDCDQVNGQCNDTPAGSYTCSCKSGYIMLPDKSCVDIDECANNNGGCSRYCRNTVGSFNCDCGYGYYGEHSNNTICHAQYICEKENHLCDQGCKDRRGYYLCTCEDDFFLELDGHTCLALSSCTTRTCDALLGGCAVVSGVERCFCPNGYQLSGDGSTCLDKDECMIGIHGCGANTLCENKPGSYECHCLPGFRMKTYALECENINECNEIEHGCSQLCRDTHGTYHCDCHSGYYLAADGTSCLDIDECAPGAVNGCSKHAKCTNYIGSYTCTCREGFIGNGFACSAIDKCLIDNGGCSGSCQSVDGNVICSCAAGHLLNLTDGVSCHDVDECALPTMPCTQACLNGDGSYQCDCLDGFHQEFSGSPNCVADPERACSRDCGHGVCLIVEGSEQCICNNGYTINVLTDLCDDMNECMSEHRCSGPTSYCLNKDGHYECRCGLGYRPFEDMITCVDIDECAAVDPRIKHMCDENSTNCDNTASSYTCVCKDGYREIYNDRFSCEDIDECQDDSGIPSCHPTWGECINFDGGFLCRCKPGFQGDGRNCIDINECLDPARSMCGNSQGCRNTNGSFICECKEGYKMDALGHCTDIDECSSPLLNECGLGCENTLGAYKCMCPRGYRLNPTTGKTCEIAIPCNDPLIVESCWQECVRIEEIDYCTCRKGFTTRGNKCYDIDECTTPDVALQHKCGDHSVCNNTEGGYDCLCDRYYIQDKDGLACSESDGNWGTWTIWTSCSRNCHGRRTRHRSCDSPLSTKGRQCAGENTEHAMCQYHTEECRATNDEAKRGVFFDMDLLQVPWWENAETPFFEAMCKVMNTFCAKNHGNYKKCCFKEPETDDEALFRRPFCQGGRSDVRLARGYPREGPVQGTRVLVYMDVLKNNALCGLLLNPNSNIKSGRQKRNVDDKYNVQPELIIEALNNSAANSEIKRLVGPSPGTSPDPEWVRYTMTKSYNEDAISIVTPTAAPVDHTALITYTLAVFFSMLVLLLLALAVFYLLRNPYRVSNSEEDLMIAARSGTPVDLFKSETDVQKGDDEKAIVQELLIDRAVSSMGRSESEIDLPNTPLPDAAQEGDVGGYHDSAGEKPVSGDEDMSADSGEPANEENLTGSSDETSYDGKATSHSIVDPTEGDVDGSEKQRNTGNSQAF